MAVGARNVTTSFVTFVDLQSVSEEVLAWLKSQEIRRGVVVSHGAWRGDVRRRGSVPS